MKNKKNLIWLAVMAVLLGWTARTVFQSQTPGQLAHALGSADWRFLLLGLGLMLFTFFTDNDPAMNQRLSWQQRVGVLRVARRLAELNTAANDQLSLRRAVGARKGLPARGKIVLPVGVFAWAVGIRMVRQA